MEKTNELSRIIEGLKEIKQEEKMVVPKCEFCGKTIVGSKWNKEYHHINICQDPKKRLFCSRQCKIKWIFQNF